MAQSSTPTRATGGEKASHSTPVIHDRMRSHLDPLITRELEGKILPTTHGLFLKYALGAPPEQVDKWWPFLSKLSQREEAKGYMAQLSKAKGKAGRYKPFCDLANFILDQTKKTFPLPTSAIPLRFAHNGPTPVKGPDHASTPPRKPDVVIVLEEVATWLELSSAERSTSGRSHIYWADIIAAVEFGGTTKKTADTVPGNGNQYSKKVIIEAQSASGSRPRPACQTVSELNSPSKRRLPAPTPGLEPRTKKFRSGPGSGSVHTGQSGVRHADFNQLSSYPLEMLSSTNGTRSHALGMFVDGAELQLWYYDRAGAIHSETRVDLADFPSFGTIVMALARLPLTMFGVLSFVNFPPNHVLPTSLEGATITLRDRNDCTHVLTLTADMISNRPGIVGRSAFVCGAKCATLDDELVLKFSYQDVSRIDEYDFIQRAKNHSVDHIPIVHVSRDVGRLSDGVRGKLISRTDEGKLQYTDRVLRVMVSKRYTPVYELGCPLPIFQTVMRDIFQCLYQLRTKAGILHRDISHTNIMAEKMPDGSFRGILNDFDLAVCLTTPQDVGPCSQHRTGTLPFMAVALLSNRPVVHLFRHDLESLFYVLVWISAHYDRFGHDINHGALKSWQRGEISAASKQFFVLQPSELDELQLSEFYKPLKALWLEPLRWVFADLFLQWLAGLNGRKDHATNDEELYNKIISVILSVQTS